MQDKNLNNSMRALKIALQTENTVYITPSASVISLPLQCGSTTDINNVAQNRKLTFLGYQEIIQQGTVLPFLHYQLNMFQSKWQIIRDHNETTRSFQDHYMLKFFNVNI